MFTIVLEKKEKILKSQLFGANFSKSKYTRVGVKINGFKLIIKSL